VLDGVLAAFPPSDRGFQDWPMDTVARRWFQ
jgi:hypothetical protein